MKAFLSIIILLAFSLSLSVAKPMEPLDHYNVVLIHGAADSTQGFIGQCCWHAWRL